jgi:AcrR family transcriptional regulator
MAKRSVQPTETTGDRIFAAARELFDTEGLPGLSMRKIAGVVGVTPMAIYKHYADKNALIDALMLDGFLAWEARVRKLSAKAPIRWLESFFDAFLEFSIAEPRRYEAAFLLPARQARRYPDHFSTGRSPALNMAYERIEEAQALEFIDNTPAIEVALTLSALGQGLISMYRAGRFVSEKEFRLAYRRAIRRSFQQFVERRTEAAQ